MDFVIQYWVQVLFAAIIAFVVKMRKENIKENLAMRNGMVAILRDSMIRSFNHYSEKGYCPIYARESVESMYHAYHDLGGNGTITTLYEKLQRLPTERGEKHG